MGAKAATEAETGANWPDIPGWPLHPRQDGFHWLRFQRGALTIGQWSSKNQAWVLSYLGGISEADELAHLDYAGPISQPAGREEKEALDDMVLAKWMELVPLLQSGRALTTDRARVRAIGCDLNLIGGFAAMSRMAMAVRRMYPTGEGGEEGWHPQELDVIWHGIGEWEA